MLISNFLPLFASFLTDDMLRLFAVVIAAAFVATVPVILRYFFRR